MGRALGRSRRKLSSDLNCETEREGIRYVCDCRNESYQSSTLRTDGFGNPMRGADTTMIFIYPFKGER